MPLTRAQAQKQAAKTEAQANWVQSKHSNEDAPFLDLQDDILGKVYSMLQDREDRKAFRQTCKGVYESKAVKQCISCCDLELQRASETGNILAPLLAVPTGSKLHTLQFSGISTYKDVWINGGAWSLALHMALEAAAETECARAKMAGVTQLKIKDCTISKECAEKLCSLFVSLCSPHSRGSLLLEDCELGENALSSLFARLRLESLAIRTCRYSGSSSSSQLEGISSMSSSLQNLTFTWNRMYSYTVTASDVSRYLYGLDLKPLAGCTQLTHLYLGGGKKGTLWNVESVGDVLSKLPSLRTLGLPSTKDACSIVPPWVHSVVFDLRLRFTPGESELHPEIVAICELQVPMAITMQRLSFREQGSAEEEVSNIRKLCAMPFKLVCTEECHLDFNADWKIPELVSVVDALEPTKESFASVRVLGVSYVCVDRLSLRALCSLFCGCRELIMDMEIDTDWHGNWVNVYERGGLLDLVQGMPNLSLLVLPQRKLRPPVDLVPALQFVRDAGRALKVIMPASYPRKGGYRIIGSRSAREAVEQGFHVSASESVQEYWGLRLALPHQALPGTQPRVQVVFTGEY